MKQQFTKAIVLEYSELEEAIRNLAFKKSPSSRNTSKLPDVNLVFKDGKFEAHVLIEVQESEVKP